MIVQLTCIKGDCFVPRKDEGEKLDLYDRLINE
jgi:hypothetical protein